MSVRAIPSFCVSLAEVLRPGVRLHVYREKLQARGLVATVAQVEPQRVRLRLDAQDLDGAGLYPGSQVALGFGAVDSGMLFLSEVVLEEVGVDEVVVSYPAPPRKQPRRAYARADLNWSCQIGRKGAGLAASETINVSAEGALVGWPVAVAPPVVEERIALVLDTPERSAWAIPARVVRLVSASQGLAVALQFLDVPEVEEMKLQLSVLRGIARRYIRVDLRRRCRLEFAGGVIEGGTENLSGSGLLMRVTEGAAPSVGEAGVVSAWLDPDPAAAPLAIPAAMVARVRVDDAGSTLVALDYSNTAREVRSTIVEIVMAALRRV